MTQEVNGEKITFSFGENWLDFLSTVDEQVRAPAIADLDRWLGLENIKGKSVVDIGSGSGLSSYAFRHAGCARLTSIDVDPRSVEATSQLASQHPEYSDGWTIGHGSVLDDDFIAGLERFDIVYSWGVLHHTGEMWRAIDNASKLCKDDGIFWISIYQGGPRYAADLELKRRYNAADEATKKQMIEARIEEYKRWNVQRGLDPEDWNMRNERGMNAYHDIVDWLGGLPYEVARPSEILFFCQSRGFVADRVMEAPEGGCSIYKMRKSVNASADTPFDYCTDIDGATVPRTPKQQHEDELHRADELYLSVKKHLEARVVAAERRAAVGEGRLASGSHIVRAAIRRAASTFRVKR